MRKLGYYCIYLPNDTHVSEKKRLKDAGCTVVFKDHLSVHDHKRPGLDTLLTELRSGDSISVYRLSYLASSLQQLLPLLTHIHAQNAHIICLDPALDSRHELDLGNLCNHLLMAHEQMVDKRLFSARQSAKSRGLQGGRPEKISDRQKQDLQQLYYDNIPVESICDRYAISRPTFYKYLKQ